MRAPLDICIGFDPLEAASFFVLAHSLMRYASKPIRIMPLMKRTLEADGFKRAHHPEQSTDFTFSRFLTPYYAESRISIFMDCDMLCRSDIWELVQIAEGNLYQDVWVVQHDYTPTTPTKFLDQKQTVYPCKNWSSLMVFNGHRQACKALRPEMVAAAPPMELHQFKWAAPTCIGRLPLEWNHLVGEYAPNPDAKLVHYTLGGPWFREYQDCEYAYEWYQERALLLYGSEFRKF